MSVLGTLICFPALAKLQTKTVEYKQGETVLEGVLSFDDKFKGPRPAVIVIHEWMGLDDYAKMRTKQLAEQGYIAFAADIYGKGVKVADMKQAGELAGKCKGDRALLRALSVSTEGWTRRHPRMRKTSKVKFWCCTVRSTPT